MRLLCIGAAARQTTNKILDRSNGMTQPGRNRLAEKLLLIAARRSVASPLGWAHPDCEVLEEAARIVRGDPPKKPDDGRADAVLS